jgi:Brp/Blh family beta-carotene 15,15'-monooxygenase
MKKNDIQIENLSNWMVVTTFFSLWLAVQFEESIENLFAYTLILTFGILHGANDLKLIERSKASQRSDKDFIKTLLYYALFVLVSAIFFYFLPTLALLLFVLFSGYHFGEQHWNSRIGTNSILGRIFFLCYGLFILFLLFYLHVTTVTDIVQSITRSGLSKPIYFYGTLFCGLLSLVTFFILTFKNESLKAFFFRELFYVGVFFVVFSTASLLWSFAIYFVLWHSIPSLADQINFLYGGLSKNSIIKYAKSSFPYWVVSIVGLSVLLYFFSADLESSFPLFFAFLAAITFPHVMVINKMNNPPKTSNEN